MALTAWRTFVTVCRLGSLSAAAAELGYTQSAVSRQIAGLEREVGAPLVDRHARGIRPTAAGEAFRQHAQAAVHEADRAIRAARDARDDLNAADLPGKIALVATGHAIALTPSVMVTTLRADVTTLRLFDPPTRGIYSVRPRRDPHPSAHPLIRLIVMLLR
jgi:DNA-binding transcriptional LysR family regulator